MTIHPDISVRAALLLALVQRRPRSWSELRAAGLGAGAVHDAAEELRARGEGVHLGGELVELEGGRRP